MKIIGRYLIFIWGIILFFSCSSSDLIEKQQTVGGVTFDLTQRSSSFNNGCCFTLGLSKNNAELLTQLENEDMYKMVLSNLSIGVENKIMIKVRNDTIYPSFSYFDRTYGTTSKNSILLCFSEENFDKKKTNNSKFIIKDFGIGTGDVVFFLNINLNK